MNLVYDDTQLEEQSQDTYVLEVHAVVRDKQKDQSSEKTILEGQ